MKQTKQKRDPASQLPKEEQEELVNRYMTQVREPTKDERVTLEIDSKYGFLGDNVTAILRAILRELVLRRIGG